MQHKTWTTIDKTEWGVGPWRDEPDKEQWEDEATGLACLIKRNPRGGNLCGYVGVPDTHPLYGVGYSDCLKPGCSDEDWCYEHSPEGVLDVHGGITYSDLCQEGDDAETICHIPAPGEPEPLFWFGFDAAHAGDVSPGYDFRYGYEPFEGDTYKDAKYMRSECAKLAAQLANFA
jgi:hypothetical protein